MPSIQRSRAIVLGVAATALVTLGADEPKTQTVNAGGLSFRAPAEWKSEKPTSTMRQAQLKVAPAEGDTDPAELVVFAFPGGAGTVEQNVERWQQQFEDKEGNPPEITTKKVKGKNVDVTVVECAGRYVAAVRPGSPEKVDKPGYRLLGAIVTTPRVGYFLKMVGPDKTMTAAKPAFEELTSSLELKGR